MGACVSGSLTIEERQLRVARKALSEASFEAHKIDIASKFGEKTGEETHAQYKRLVENHIENRLLDASLSSGDKKLIIDLLWTMASDSDKERSTESAIIYNNPEEWLKFAKGISVTKTARH